MLFTVFNYELASTFPRSVCTSSCLLLYLLFSLCCVCLIMNWRVLFLGLHVHLLVSCYICYCHRAVCWFWTLVQLVFNIFFMPSCFTNVLGWVLASMFGPLHALCPCPGSRTCNPVDVIVLCLRVTCFALFTHLANGFCISTSLHFVFWAFYSLL